MTAQLQEKEDVTVTIYVLVIIHNYIDIESRSFKQLSKSYFRRFCIYFLISGDATELLKWDKGFISEIRDAAKNAIETANGIVSMIQDAVKDAMELLEALTFVSEKKKNSELDIQDSNIKESFLNKSINRLNRLILSIIIHFFRS